MPLVLEGTELPEPTLRELYESLRTDLTDLESMIAEPRGAVRDPASLTTAAELLHGARTLLEGRPPADRNELAARTNLAYGVLLAVIDLVKSHTDGPRVPQGPAARERTD